LQSATIEEATDLRHGRKGFQILDAKLQPQLTFASLSDAEHAAWRAALLPQREPLYPPWARAAADGGAPLLRHAPCPPAACALLLCAIRGLREHTAAVIKRGEPQQLSASHADDTGSVVVGEPDGLAITSAPASPSITPALTPPASPTRSRAVSEMVMNAERPSNTVEAMGCLLSPRGVQEAMPDVATELPAAVTAAARTLGLVAAPRAAEADVSAADAQASARGSRIAGGVVAGALAASSAYVCLCHAVPRWRPCRGAVCGLAAAPNPRFASLG
jgi:hypothetical protein